MRGYRFEKQRRTWDPFGIDYIFTVFDTVSGICWSIQKGKQASKQSNPKNQNEGFAELRILATHVRKSSAKSGNNGKREEEKKERKAFVLCVWLIQNQ